jgi:DNA-binding Xre family transcriptional regulator
MRKMEQITLKIPNEETARQIIAALCKLGVIKEEGSDMDLVSAEEFDQLLYHGDEKLKFARRLKVLRKDKKLTLRKLDEMTGIPYSHLSEIENAKRTIGVKYAKRLAKALDADYKYFI